MFRKVMFAAFLGLALGATHAGAVGAGKNALDLNAASLAKSQARKIEAVYSDVVIVVSGMSCMDKTVSAKVVGGSNSPGNIGNSLRIESSLCSKLSSNYDRVRALRASKGEQDPDSVKFKVEIRVKTVGFVITALKGVIGKRDGSSGPVEVVTPLQ